MITETQSYELKFELEEGQRGAYKITRDDNIIVDRYSGIQLERGYMMPEGQIRKAISGFYYVENDGEIVQCRGRGVFRNRGIHPLVGDFVTYVRVGDNDATVTVVHERRQ